MDLERQVKNFDKHIATLTDLGNIKILDFKKPESNNYRIRFLFEEDYYRLHISGDLGHLIATNYNNMTFEGFKRDFSNNVEYFVGKINCHDRRLYNYDYDDAEKSIREFIEDYDLVDDIADKYCLFDDIDEEDKENAIKEFVEDALEYFGDDGISSHGYEAITDIYADAFEMVSDFGKRDSGIIELYLLAFRLAIKQLEENE